MEKTIKQYDIEFASCHEIFVSKGKDYGHTWRVFRISSLTDQMLIKVRRIRQLENSGESAVGEGVEDEYRALVNYGIMAVVQDEQGILDELSKGENVDSYYVQAQSRARALMIAKNTDYGEAWRELRPSSITDLIFVKLLRIVSIEKNNGMTQVSEGAVSNYLDIINYAIFALILLKENKDK